MYSVPASRSQPKNTGNVCSLDQKRSIGFVPQSVRMSLCRVIVWSSFTYIHSAVDAEELAGLIIEFFQIFSVPVEIWCEEQVRPQVYTVSVKGGCEYKGFKQCLSS